MSDAHTIFSYQTGAKTHEGCVREVNEDNYLVRPRHGLWVVADGMGGHENGRLASQTVVDALQDISVPQTASELMDVVESRVISANATLRDYADSHGGAVLGSTVVALLTHRGSYACVWSGDSRIYLSRGGRLSQVTRDHTEVQELVDQGILSAQEAKTWPRANVVTRAIGVHDEPSLDVETGQLRDGDCFVLCSDGLTGHVDDPEIEEILVGQVAQEASDTLVNLALERGGKDNVTVIVVRVREPDPEETLFYPEEPRPARPAGGRS